ncbi:MAG TPA: acetyl-CoA decarbonylase/synthase complex subunit alpha/beta [Candidatus Bathyarchaeia archaeon]|nr:acetyl-CoA decarbonylase/synthase complex subunit alpha/beta [Candidatus Bathyarchaeia archaeon]
MDKRRNRKEPKKVTVDPAALEMLPVADQGHMQTMWDRAESMQPQCRFGESGLCCRICLQGPCRINPFGKEPQRGICGAKDYTIVARNLIRMMAGGCAAHSDHGRHLASALKGVGEGQAPDYRVKDEAKLRALATSLGLDSSKSISELAVDVANAALEDFSRSDDKACSWLKILLPPARLELLERNDVIATNIDKGITEVMHRTHMGCDADPVPLIFGGIKCSLGDVTGENISSNLSDVLFGVPQMVVSEANLGALKEDHVNVCVHGHNPILSEVICDAADELQGEAIAAGANGINIVGICCTANELLMRRGIPIVTNFASQELAIMTGVVDVMVIDYQCIAPSVGFWTQCFHTKLISTMPITRIPGDTHIEFNEAAAREGAKEIVRIAIEAYKNRDPTKISIPDISSKVVAGFSLEYIKSLLSRFNEDKPLAYLAEKIRSGDVQGIALIAGCNNPTKAEHDLCHLTIAKELVKNNILTLVTGCAAQSLAKHGLMTPEAVDQYAGESLKAFLKDVGEKTVGQSLPLVLHMGSCVDNSRVENLVSELAQVMGLDMQDLPIVASAPEAMSEKAVAIGTWCVATGWPTHVGVYPFIKGSPLADEVAQATAQDVYGGHFIFEPDPVVAARTLVNTVQYRRWKMDAHDELDGEVTYWNGTTSRTAPPQLSNEGLCKKAIDGAIIATGYADQLLNKAIRLHGRDKEIGYPSTGYYLPCITAWTGEQVTKLGQLPRILGEVRGKIREEYTFENAVASGEATMIAAEIVEALKYIDNSDPYAATPYTGFVPDEVLRKLGISFVDDTIPGVLVLVGKARDPKLLAKIIRDCQSKGMLVIPTFDTIQQIREAGIEIGEHKGLDRLLFCVGEFTQAIHALSFAIRAALTFGNVKPGDREALFDYLAKRPKVVVVQLGPIDDIKVAIEFAVLFNGSPTITDQDVEEVPGKYEVEKDYNQIVAHAIEIRNMKVTFGEVSLPVAYGLAFEGETVRKPQTYVECGGPTKTQVFELVKIRDAEAVKDGQITLIGKDVDEMGEGSVSSLGILVEVYGKHMKSEFEPVVERRIHQFINYAEGAWHTGQRNLIWVRLSKNSVANGLRFRHFGDILYHKMKEELGGIISRIQVTILTDEQEVKKHLPEAMEAYAERDRRIAGLTDESVDEFYSCTLCQSFAPSHVCIISPERLGLCGALNWLDAAAGYSIDPNGPNKPVEKGATIDEQKGQWLEVNQAVRELTHGHIERMNQYTMMEDPQTSCGCFECIVAINNDLQGVIVVNREYTGMTPIGMKFSTLAGSVGGGNQTPGFIGVGRQFIASKKFIRADGGLARVVWMPKDLKAALREDLEKRARELGVPDLVDKIADETITTDADELAEYLVKVDHPALRMPPMGMF